MLMKVLVTGGTGFIGSHLVDRLINDGCNVRVIDDLSTGKLDNIQSHLSAGRVDFVKGDIRDPSLVSKSVSGVDFVVHLAAVTSVPFSVLNPDLTFDVNVGGTVNLIRACAQEDVGRFLFVSSCAVFGDQKLLPVSENHQPFPISPYAESKLIAEHYCLGFHHRRLLRSVVLRFFNVYGPRQGMNDYSGVITRFIDCVRRKEPLVIYGDGSQTRDFVNVRDVVEAVYACLKSSFAEGEVFNIGSGKATSVGELARLVLDLAGVNLEVRYEKPRAGDIKNSRADVSKAKRLLGFEPRVPLRDGLRELLDEGLRVG
jgi:UDP-glucose 4-epimerase